MNNMLFLRALRLIHQHAADGQVEGVGYIRAATACSLTMLLFVVLDPSGLAKDLRTGDPLELLTKPPTTYRR